MWVCVIHMQPRSGAQQLGRGCCQVCPLMLRVFTRRGGHHRLEDFARRGHEPDDEVSMYTWPDATLRELSDLVKEVCFRG